MEQKIYYEQPLTERMRTLLRLEHLYDQIHTTLTRDSIWDARTAVRNLLDIQDVFGRMDIKTDLLKELERLSGILETLEKNPNVDGGKLTSVLDEIDLGIDRIHAISGPIGNQLKKNELLSSIRQRSAIPGGTCDFDLPAYHYWLEQGPEKRKQDLEEWLGHFDTILTIAQLILKLIRDSAPTARQTAKEGFFQQTLDPGSPCQLVRVGLPVECPYYAEISGGKHRFSIRFLTLRLYDSDIATDDDVDFDLSCCAL